MRQNRIVLVVIGLLLSAATAVQAQHSDAACGCNACMQQGCAQPCCPPLLPSITEGIHQMLGGLFCCPGLNARHDIYRAALHRNDFGKCSKYVPFYSCRKCCCGGVNPACPQCGTGAAAGGEEVIEMQGVPEGVEMEPTPAVEPEMAPTPVETVPPQATRVRTSRDRGRTTLNRVANPPVSAPTAPKGAVRDRVARAEVGDENALPIARTAGKQPAKAPSLIQRAMLLQQRDTEPVNGLRK